MSESNEANERYATLAKILLRCFFLGYFVLLLSVAVCVLAREMIHSIGDKLFGLTPHEVDVVNYCSLAAAKFVVILFFLIPYIAIRWVLRKRV